MQVVRRWWRTARQSVMTAAFVLRGYIGGMGVMGGSVGAIEKEEMVVQEATEQHKALRLRAYRPANQSERLPCVVYVHGTAFYGGRFDDQPILVPRQNVVILCEHRGSREGGRFPAALHDVVACVRHVRANAAELNVDPDRIAVFGESSGAYMATMLAVLSAYPRPNLLGDLGKHPTESARVTCAVALFPPVKFDVMDDQHDPKFHAQLHDSPDSPEAHFMGFPVRSRSVDHASPLTYVTPHTPPVFLAHGDCDPLVPCGQSRIFFERLVSTAAVPADHQFHVLKGAGHSTHHFTDQPFADLVYDFLAAFNRPSS